MADAAALHRDFLPGKRGDIVAADPGAVAHDAIVILGITDGDTDHGQVQPLAEANEKRHVTLRIGDLQTLVGHRRIHVVAVFERHPLDFEAERIVEGLFDLGELGRCRPL